MKTTIIIIIVGIIALAAIVAFEISAPVQQTASLLETPINAMRPNGLSADFRIRIGENGFDPKDFETGTGKSITFENTGTEPHWPASDIHPTHGIYPEFDAKRALAPGDTWTFTFAKAGVWRMHDHINPQFSGIITVIGDDAVTPTDSRNKQNSSTDTEEKISLIEASIDKNTASIFTDKDALRSYVEKFGPRATIEQLHNLSPAFGDCHEPAHYAGRYAYGAHGADAFRLCTAECHSGCYHGATEAYFRDNGTRNIAENLSTICGTQLNNFFEHQCFHGIGHGLMAWAAYDMNIALTACSSLPKRIDSCWSGVFMENIVGGLGQGHSTKYLNQDPHFPCTILDKKYVPSCYFMQPTRMLQLYGKDFRLISSKCSEAPDAQSAHMCFSSMGREVGSANRNKPQGAIADCGFVPEGPMRISCLNGAVQDNFWDPSGQDVALQFCAELAGTAEKNGCYYTIFERATQVIAAKQDFLNFCAKAEKEYEASCISMTEPR